MSPPGMAEQLEEDIRVRVTPSMRQALESIAVAKTKKVSELAREALVEYLERRGLMNAARGQRKSNR